MVDAPTAAILSRRISYTRGFLHYPRLALQCALAFRTWDRQASRATPEWKRRAESPRLSAPDGANAYVFSAYSPPPPSPYAQKETHEGFSPVFRGHYPHVFLLCRLFLTSCYRDTNIRMHANYTNPYLAIRIIGIIRIFASDHT